MRSPTVLVAVALVLVACTVGRAPTSTPAAVTPAPVVTGTLPPVIGDATLVPSPTAAPLTLRLWLPPQFAADPASAAGQVLQKHLSEFQTQNPGVQLDIRVKRTTGMGGMLESLESAQLVAPNAMADVILIDHNLLAQAETRALIQPLGGLLAPELLSTSAEFARPTPDSVTGLPLFGETTLLVYNTALLNSPPTNWAEVQAANAPFTFAGGNLQGGLVLQQYLAVGGRIQSETGELLPDVIELSEALSVLQSLNRAGVLYIGTLNYTTSADSWQAYRENRAVLAVTDSVSYLRERRLVVNTAAIPVPTLGGAARQLFRVWYLAIPTVEPLRQAQAAALVEWLSEPVFLAEWSLALGHIPLQAPALTELAAQPDLRFTSDLVASGQLLPPSTTLNQVGPVLQAALSDVINGRATPETAATTANAQLNTSN